MKKLLIILFLAFVLFGCDDKEPTEELTVPNGLAPLTPASDCDIPTLEGGWVCTWADEFSGDAIDESKWNFELGNFGGGNNELQTYTKENTEVVDGKMVITARRETKDQRSYTSSRLTTKYKGNFQYVRIITRAKMPSGRGTWPAIWMMPVMNSYGGWPNSGEIDIMEYVGYDKNRIHTTIHTEKFNHKLGTQIGYSRLYENVETEFKDYEMIWTPGKILTYVDGDKLGEFNYVAELNKDVKSSAAFPFDQMFFLIINLAVGGDWGGAQGVDDTIFPTALEVDYVRVYKQDYATLDTENPTQPGDIQLAMLKNSIYWTKSTDDYGVEEYAVYLDGKFHKYTRLNQIVLTGLVKDQTYLIQVQAVDFVGRVSPLSNTLSYTYKA